MPDQAALPAVPGGRLISALQAAGFKLTRVSGSHHRLKHPDGRATTVPVHGNKDVPKARSVRSCATAGSPPPSFATCFEPAITVATLANAANADAHRQCLAYTRVVTGVAGPGKAEPNPEPTRAVLPLRLATSRQEVPGERRVARYPAPASYWPVFPETERVSAAAQVTNLAAEAWPRVRK